MALLWIEGFEGFGTSTGVAPAPTGILGRKYPTVAQESSMTIENGTYGKCLEIPGDVSGFLRTPDLTTNGTLVIGCAVKWAALPTVTPDETFSFYDGATRGINLRLDIDGKLSVHRSSTLLGTSTNVISVATWYYVELKILTHNSNGTVDLKVNETSWLSLSSQDTQQGSNAYHTAIQLGYVPNETIQYDDVYCLDGSGSINNDFLGRRQVQAIRPDAAGATTEWDPNTGANYAAVDEVQLDEDTTYVETTFTGEKDLYNYESSVGSSIIDGIQVMTEAKATVGSMDLHTIVKSGSTEDDGSADPISSSTYVTSRRLEETNPDTSAKWTPSEVDSVQFGVKAV